MFHQKYLNIVGVDVASNKLDLHDHVANQHHQIDNSPQAIQSYLKKIRKTQSDILVVMEATGGYERELVDQLHENGIECTVVNPLRIRQFAQACGKLEKNDKIDARMIAEFGAFVLPVLHQQPTPQQRKLQSLNHRRDQILSNQQAEKNRLKGETDKEIKESIQEAIEFYQKQLKRVEAQIAKTIKEDQELSSRSAVLRSCPAVGPVTTAVLMTELPELGTLNRGQVAKLVGVAPIDNDSGTKTGKKKTKAGRTRVRKALYMAAMVATQKNQRFKTKYQALLKTGKPKKVALVAIARKLLVTLNAMMKNQNLWSETSLAID